VRRDVVEMIDELKYSPDGKLLAVGSHDNYIDVYSTTSYEVRRPYTSIGTPLVSCCSETSVSGPACLPRKPPLHVDSKPRTSNAS
jgi:WD40 repeat protein